MYTYYGLNRTMCDVLEEMRKLDSTKNYGSLLSLIEEIQSMGNRMEAALSDAGDLRDIKAEIKSQKKKLKKIMDTLEEAKDE